MERLLFAILLFSLLTIPASHAGVAVIVHPDNQTALTVEEIRSIYLGKINTYRNGEKAIPLDITNGNQNLRKLFTNKVLRKKETSLNAYWARMLFSSRAAPPRPVGSSIAVKEFVAVTPGAIGYIDTADVDASVRIIFELVE